MTYGAGTWSLTYATVHNIQVAQRAMKRAMLGIKLQDRVRNFKIRRRTKIRDVDVSQNPEIEMELGKVCY